MTARMLPGDIGCATVEGHVVLAFGARLLTKPLTPEEVDDLRRLLRDRADEARLYRAVQRQQRAKGPAT